MDVKNIFLHGDLKETFYMHQVLGFKEQTNSNHVCLLRKSLYGFKQASRAWYKRFDDYVSFIGFSHSNCDLPLSLFTRKALKWNTSSYMLMILSLLVPLIL